jgi:hypothetical protein
VADGLLSDPRCAFHRNVEISSRYAWMYKLQPACFKWAAMAAIASHHVRLALFPLRLDTDRTGYVDIPHSLRRPRLLLTQDVNTIRATNNAIFNDLFWVHFAYVTAEDGIERLRSPASGAPLCTCPRGFEAIDQGRRDRTSSATASPPSPAGSRLPPGGSHPNNPRGSAVSRPVVHAQLRARPSDIRPCRRHAWPRRSPIRARSGWRGQQRGWRSHRRFYARALTINRPRSVTAVVLGLSPAAGSSRGHRRPATAWADGARLGSRLPGRDAEGFGMGPAVVLGQGLAEVAGPVREGAVADLAARDRKVGNGHREAAGT